MTEQRADVYTRITTQIVAAIEAGTGDWRLAAPAEDGCEGDAGRGLCGART